MWAEFMALLVFLLVFAALSISLHWIGEAVDWALSKFGAEDHESEWW